ncbi:hypothetical protein VTJ04DRAFT_1527 [Mycothermus thermophilus]|uniref:uncharacterized protein n=1 Tax=Humicola insolens TaxID=85995 RepID=UPI0037436BF7
MLAAAVVVYVTVTTAWSDGSLVTPKVSMRHIKTGPRHLADSSPLARPADAAAQPGGLQRAINLTTASFIYLPVLFAMDRALMGGGWLDAWGNVLFEAKDRGCITARVHVHWDESYYTGDDGYDDDGFVGAGENDQPFHFAPYGTHLYRPFVLQVD